MEVFNQFVAQLRSLFQSMTPGARVTSALLLTAVVVSLGFLFASGGTSTDELLFGGEPLSNTEVRAIEQALLSRGIDVDVSGGRVRVASARKYDAMAAIAESDALPLNIHAIMAKALDSGSIFEGSAKTKERIKAARAHYLSMIISSFQWVETAYVSHDEKRSHGLNRDDVVTAAVTVTPAAGEVVNYSRKKMLQRLTAKWFAGMVPDQVEVVDTVNAGSSGSDGSQAYAELTEDNPILQQQFAYEQQKKSEILNLLGPIRGALVEVHAVLSSQVASRTYTKTPDEKGTLQQTEMEEELTTSASVGPGGRAGLEAQGPGAQPERPSPTQQNDSTVTRDSNSYLVGFKEETTEEAGPGVLDVNATVRIPMDWLVETVWEQVWKNNNPDADEAAVPPPTDADLKRLEEEQRTQLQSDIENILPEKSAGQNPFPRVRVSFYHAPEATPIPEPALSQTALAWTAANWSTLAMFGLALASLWMLRSIIKTGATHGATAAVEGPTLQFELPADKEESAEEEESRPRLRLKKGPTLKDDLAELVREDPDTAATILRAWINDAA